MWQPDNPKFSSLLRGAEFGGLEAFEKTFDIIEKQTRSIYEQQEAQQQGVQAAAEANKLAKQRKEWEEESLKTIEKTPPNS